MQTKSNHVYFVGTAVVLAMVLSWGRVPAVADGAVKTLDTPAVAKPVRRTEVSIRGDMFFINGRPTYEGRTWRGHKIEGLLMNARLVQGIFDDLNPQTIGRWAYPDTGEWDPERNTREFIAAMPSWREHGLLSFTINLQGGSPEGYSREQPWHNSALRADGSLRPAFMDRLERILDKADELGMAPMLGIFYFGQDQRLTDEKAVKQAVINTVDWIADRGYTNVLLEIANEHNAGAYQHYIIRNRPEELIVLAQQRAAERNLSLPVSVSLTGGRIPSQAVVDASDFILLHGNGVRDPKRMAGMVETVRSMAGSTPKPIVNNEDDQPWRVAEQGFGYTSNNFTACVENYASWGYFDFRRPDEDFNEGFQSVPVNWQISSDRKRAFFGLMARITGVGADDDHRIQPYSGNPFYWQYEGKPVLLLGGSWQDNLFNHPVGLERHLDLLKSVGGNYVRNVMSHRNLGNVFAYKEVDGMFDLDQWNDEYWRRFENFLRLTHERDIIVQIEVFDRHDLSADHQSQGGWSKHPFNPANNRTYSPEASLLPIAITTTPGRGHPFFTVVPALQNNELVLRYQRAYVDKMLSISLKYPHVLYCIQNESSQELAFGDYWAEHVLRRARQAERTVFVTDMRNNWDISHRNHHHIYDNPNRFNFLDVSQNSWQSGQIHYDRILHVRQHIADRPRPINTTKIYNRDGDEESVARMFRIIFAGGASARFHRPHPLEGPGDHEKTSKYGIGLSHRAQAVLRSARMLADAINVFVCEPRNDLLSERSPNEAYCLAEPGRQYAVYFPDDGQVKLDVSDAQGPLQVRWLDISRSAWREPRKTQGREKLELKTPGQGHWAVLLRSASETEPPAAQERIGPWPDNPHYLAWGGTPVFPLGATSYHSWTPISRPRTVDFQVQLDRLAQVIDEIGSPHVCGFVRCLPYDPMNHMHDGAVKEVLQPWVKLADGRYDLERFEPAWEKRLRAFLTATLKRRIVVSLEIWDDWSVTRGPGGAYDPGAGAAWNAHPFNPNNNVNYDHSVLSAATARCDAPFYITIPSRRHVRPVLDLQKLYVDKLLAIASEYPNVLFSIANESRAHLDWSRFWAEYVRKRVPSGMMIGEMPSTNRKDGGGECEHAFSPMTLCTDPRYDYVDVSQGVSGHEFRGAPEQAFGGGRRIAEYRRVMAEAGTRRPLVVSKDYTRGPDGGDMVLWGRFFGGAATARFHRLAGNHPESVSRFQHEAVGRLGRFIARVPFWRMHPAPGLVKRLPAGAGANVLAEPGGQCVVQLLGGSEGDTLQLDLPSGVWTIRWINPATGDEMARTEAAANAAGLELELPAGPDHKVLHLERLTQ